MHLLVVEDDPRLSRVLKRLLEEDRHVVELATDGRTAIEIGTGLSGLDVVVLDVGLPDVSGLGVGRPLRTSGVDPAILMLTARDAVGDRVSGLDAGADDYLVKPFADVEPPARLRAPGRRSTARRRPDPKLRSGEIELDESLRRVSVAGRQTDLSPREFALLECF